MAANDFDIVAWGKWKPAKYRCPQCSALYSHVSWSGRGRFSLDTSTRECSTPGCGYKVESPGAPPFENKLNLEELAEVASKMPPHTSIENMSGTFAALVLQAIYAATRFIHFSTYSLDSLFLTAVYMASHRVSVRGMVGTSIRGFRQDFIDTVGIAEDNYKHEVTVLTPPLVAPPHVKLLVIDGVLAFKGSANLSLNAFMNLDKDVRIEVGEVVSLPDEVMKLNNEHFAPLWLKNSGDVDGTLPF